MRRYALYRVPILVLHVLKAFRFKSSLNLILNKIIYLFLEYVLFIFNPAQLEICDNKYCLDVIQLNILYLIWVCWWLHADVDTSLTTSIHHRAQLSHAWDAPDLQMRSFSLRGTRLQFPTLMKSPLGDEEALNGRACSSRSFRRDDFKKTFEECNGAKTKSCSGGRTRYVSGRRLLIPVYSRWKPAAETLMSDWKVRNRLLDVLFRSWGIVVPVSNSRRQKEFRPRPPTFQMRPPERRGPAGRGTFITSLIWGGDNNSCHMANGLKRHGNPFSSGNLREISSAFILKVSNWMDLCCTIKRNVPMYNISTLE